MINKNSLMERVYNYIVNNAGTIIFLWAFWLTLEYFALGPFSYLRIHDFGDYLPMRFVLSHAFFQHGFSNWFPYSACGIDRLSISLLNISQVDNLFFCTLPKWLACGFVKFLQCFLAGYFTYRLCGDCLKLDRMPSIVAGLVYAIFSIQELLVVQFAGLLGGLPFILWSLEYIGKRESFSRYLLAFVLGILSLFSSNFALSVPFVLPMVLVWFVFVRQNYSLRFLSIYCIFAAVIIIGNAPLISALLINAPLSQRAYWPTINPLLGGSFEVMLIHSIFSGLSFLKSNVAYCGLGILGLFWIKFKDRRFLIVMLLLGFCGIGTYLVNSFWIFVKPSIGFFSSFQIDRFYNLAPFFVAIAVGFGLHFFMREWVLTPEHALNSKRVRVQTILCVILILFLIFQSCQIKVGNALLWGGHGSYAANYENPDLQYLADNTDSAPFRVGTIAADPRFVGYGLHPAYANAYGLESVDGYVSLYPKRYHDFWGKVIEPLTSQDEKKYNYFHYWGSRIYLFEPSDVSFGKIEKIPFSEYYNLNLLSLANTKYIISRKAIVNENLTLLPSQIPQPERGWAELSTMEQVKRGFGNNFEGRGLYIYENKNVFPRVFLVDQLEIFPDPTQLLDSLAKANISSLREAAFIEEQSASKIEGGKLGFNHGKVRIEEYSPDRITLKVDLDGSGILVITNSYNPHWTARVDGVEKTIYPVYHTFSGIYIGSGQKTVVLEYQPPYGVFKN